MGTSCRKFSFQMVGNIDLWSVPIATKEVVLKPLSCMFFCFHGGLVVEVSILAQFEILTS